MAAIGSIFLELGLRTAGFNKDISAAEANIKKTSQSLARGVDQVSSKALNQVAGIAKMVAAPLAGALSIGAMIKSYFGGVAQVAQMTGQYSTKLEEWRKKRALLNRVTQEDIQLYKKSREALVKFQITMADLSAKIMRKASPAVKFFVDLLNKLSDWVDKYADDIARFLQIIAAIITTAMLPALAKMAVALMMNPITWIVAALIGLALVIDDLIVWLNNGNSALDSFWSMFGSREEVLAKIQAAIKAVTDTLKALWESLKTGIKNAVEWFSEFWTASGNTQKVIGALGAAWESVKSIVLGIIDVWNELVAAISETSFLDHVKGAFNGALDFILGLFNFLLAGIETVVGLVKGLLTGDWSNFKEGFERSVEAVKQVVSGLWDFLVNTVGALLDAIRAIFDRVNRSLDKLIRETWEGIVNWLSETFDSIKQAWRAVCDAIAKWFKEKVDATKAAWTDFCNSIKAWIDRVIGWFADIGRAIKEAFSFDNIMKKAESMLNKLNPKNWFSSDEGQEGTKEESGGWFSGWSRNKSNLQDVSNTAAAGANAEMANVSTRNGDRTVNNNQQINMYQPDAAAVDRAFESAGMGNNPYADMVDQGAASMS